MMTLKSDNPQQRSIDTRTNLMRAAEKLIAEHGVENVTVRAITEEAGQKNESALQYHFKNRAGLIDAIHQQRNEQIQEKRTELLEALLEMNPKPTLREICKLMVEPAYRLARNEDSFRQYIRAFGREIALTNLPAMEFLSRNSRVGTIQTEILLREALAYLDDEMFMRRFDSAVKFVGLSMSRHARERNAFHGKEAEVFFNVLVDMLEALLSAPVSAETLAALKS